MIDRHLTYQECAQRFPLVIRAMQKAAILSNSEAACGIRDYLDIRDGRLPHLDFRFGGEAVENFGGCKKVIQWAWELRHGWK